LAVICLMVILSADSTFFIFPASSFDFSISFFNSILASPGPNPYILFHVVSWDCSLMLFMVEPINTSN